MRSNKLFWGLAATLFLAFVGVASYKAWPVLFPRIAQIAPLDPECDLRLGPCTSLLPSAGVITLEIRPRDIPLLQPLQLVVGVQGLAVSSVEVDFNGVDMNMGFNRPKLQSEGAGRFSGEGMLPTCTRSSMEWEAKVLVRSGGDLLAAPFRFWTANPGQSLPVH